ncbi:MAG: hypothetical protein R3Y38_07915 [Rikenellaceae bacterium]
MMITFEFKPPTETKRGILTGLGQSIAYLSNSNLSYLIIPEMLEDFRIADYMTDLFSKQIKDNLPVGLIKYDNNNPTNVSLIKNVQTTSNTIECSSRNTSRFWAKHQDLPLPLFHLMLHCYYLKKTGVITGDAFAYCWSHYMAPDTILETMKPALVVDLSGNPIKTLSGSKNISFFEKKINTYKKCEDSSKRVELRESLIKDLNTNYVGDNYYNSIRKNFVTFSKHIGVIDSNGNMTDLGFKLYHLGLVNGANSKLFIEYFTQCILIQGHHLDLIFDLDNLRNIHGGECPMSELRRTMEAEYEERGMIKRNRKRQVGETTRVEFLKYEFILWNAINLFNEGGYFNWKKIIEICSLPEL